MSRLSIGDRPHFSVRRRQDGSGRRVVLSQWLDWAETEGVQVGSQGEQPDGRSCSKPPDESPRRAESRSSRLTRTENPQPFCGLQVAQAERTHGCAAL
ncbi:hypothetical protein GN956_G14902 [Arapaima gigas]